jgi:hypothetical protein
MVRRLAERRSCYYTPLPRRALTGGAARGAHDAAPPGVEATWPARLGDRVHAEAERLEHAASDELIDRMAAALGDPAFDPHGAPIPTREGAVDERRHVALADLAPARGRAWCA